MLAALSWDGDRLVGDLALGPAGAVAGEDGLTTAVLVSLFTDRRASADDVPPDGTGDRRGWVGDVLSTVPGDRAGSRLWLLAREKQTEETRRRAVEYCREALAWLVEDGLAARVDVEAAWTAPASGILGMRIVVTRLDGAVETVAARTPVGGA
jgi:phage gp46-like protein